MLQSSTLQLFVTMNITRITFHVETQSAHLHFYSTGEVKAPQVIQKTYQSSRGYKELSLVRLSDSSASIVISSFSFYWCVFGVYSVYIVYYPSWKLKMSCSKSMWRVDNCHRVLSEGSFSHYWKKTSLLTQWIHVERGRISFYDGIRILMLVYCQYTHYISF